MASELVRFSFVLFHTSLLLDELMLNSSILVTALLRVLRLPFGSLYGENPEPFRDVGDDRSEILLLDFFPEVAHRVVPGRPSRHDVVPPPLNVQIIFCRQGTFIKVTFRIGPTKRPTPCFSGITTRSASTPPLSFKLHVYVTPSGSLSVLAVNSQSAACLASGPVKYSFAK